MRGNNASGWQTHVFALDQNTVYDAVDLSSEVLKDEDWDSGTKDDGDAYLLIDNIQFSGLNDMMQFAVLNNSAWMMGIA